jgi:uncharacterized membrane protein YuzA (DUF378 family)
MKFAFVLVVIGGINWGLVGLGMIFGSNLNVVNLIFNSWPIVEAIIYILVGISAVMKLFGCPCKKCKECTSCCSTGGSSNMMGSNGSSQM